MNNINNVVRTLNTKDKIFLKYLYRMRCLSKQQVYELFYKNMCTPEGFDIFRIKPYLSLDVLRLEYSSTGVETLFLGQTGIDIVRSIYNIPAEVHDSYLNKKINNKRTVGDLNMNPRLIDHQLNLNSFVLKFSARFAKTHPSEKFNYSDEKFLSRLQIIRPDGMISYKNIQLFLEMDMGTESKRQLLEKFNKYRLFLTDRERHPDNKKIVVLFITKIDADKMEQRKNLIRSSAEEVFTSYIKDDFEIYIGNDKELLNACFNKILPIEDNKYEVDDILIKKLLKNKHGFSITRGNAIQMSLGGAAYGYYIRQKINNTNIIRKVGNTCQEFLLDEYTYAPFSVILKIINAQSASYAFNAAYNREINYVVVVSDIKTIYEHLKCLNLFDTPTVFYTTPTRLNKLPFYKALFKLDINGNIFSPIDETYTKLKAEEQTVFDL